MSPSFEEGVVFALALPDEAGGRRSRLFAPLLSFAAGAMIYVVTEELIPESQQGKHSNIGTIGVAVGFVVMMVLDSAFG